MLSCKHDFILKRSLNILIRKMSVLLSFLTQAQRRTAAKSVTNPSSVGVLNGDCSKLKENDDKEEKGSLS